MSSSFGPDVEIVHMCNKECEAAATDITSQCTRSAEVGTPSTEHILGLLIDQEKHFFVMPGTGPYLENSMVIS